MDEWLPIYSAIQSGVRQTNCHFQKNRARVLSSAAHAWTIDQRSPHCFLPSNATDTFELHIIAFLSLTSPDCANLTCCRALAILQWLRKAHPARIWFLARCAKACCS